MLYDVFLTTVLGYHPPALKEWTDFERTVNNL